MACFDCAMLCETSPTEAASSLAAAAMLWTLALAACAAPSVASDACDERATAASISAKLWSISPRRSLNSRTCSVMSVANFTTLYGRPAASKIGL